MSAPGPAGTIAVDARTTHPGGVAAIGDSFASPRDEAFRGFGGRHNSIDQRGNEFYNWTQQENLSAGGIGGPAPPSPDPVVPLPERRDGGLLRAVVVHLARPLRVPARPRRDSRWRLASDREDAWQVRRLRRSATSSPRHLHTAIRNLTAVSGRTACRPLGDRAGARPLVQFPDQSAADYEAEVRSDLRNLSRRDIDLAAYRIEGWQFLRASPCSRSSPSSAPAGSGRSSTCARSSARRDRHGRPAGLHPRAEAG